MTSELGHAALWLAAFLSLTALSPKRLRARADIALGMASLLVLIAFAAMVRAFAINDFSVSPVNDYAHRLRPTADALAAWFVTGAGAVFLGTAALAAFGPLLAWKGRWTRAWSLLLLVVLAALLLLDPFARVELPAVEGRALGGPGLMPTVIGAAFAVACAAAAAAVVLVRTRWPLRIGAAGAVMVLIGLAGHAFGETRTVVLRPGAAVRIQGVELVLRDVRPTAGPDYTAIETQLAAGNSLPVQLRTHVSRPAETSPIATRWSPLGKVEARLLGSAGGGRWRIGLSSRPLAWALWLGGTLLIGASVLALVTLPSAARPRPGGWPALAGAALCGLLAYALAGEPLMPSRPAAPMLIDAVGPPAFAAARQELPGVFGDAAAWITIAEALDRGGSADDAVSVLLTGIDRVPDSADLWAALGNALVLHAEGTMPPAARLAYARAARIDPASPSPRYNEGIAWMLAGDPRRAVAVWEALRADSLAGASWRPALDRRLAEARAMLAQAAR